MSDSSAREELERLARYQLLLPGDALVPGDYLQEPEISLKNYSYDINGDYGTRIYRETGREGVERPMTSSAASGGNGNVAALQPYKLHALHHPTHGRWDERILAETSPGHTDYRLRPVLQHSIQGASRALSVPAGPSLLSHPPRATLPHLARQFDIPRKRSSAVALTELSDSDSDAPRPKKPRLDPPQKHPLLVVNPNLPPYITTQQTTVPNPPVPAGSSISVISQPAPVHAPSLPQGPMNEVLGERARVAATLHELRSSLSTRPDIDRNLANINAWQQHLSAIDNQIAEMQMIIAPEGFSVPTNPQPPFLVPISTVSASITPEPGPSEATHDVYPGYIESEGETSNVENDQSNGFPSLPMPEPALPTAGSSRPANLQKFLQDCNRDFFDANATVQKGLERLGLRDLEDTLPGMVLPLMPHQVLGVAFMLDREQSTFKGGILADEMGLGKTVQTIATMTQNQGADPATKTNLIVAPLALLEQWKREIETFVEPDVFKILIYHGPGRTKNTSTIQRADVVLTTYQTLALEWPDELKEARKAKKKAAKKALGLDSSDAMSEDERGGRPKYGPLMEVTFWRVILDEAQSIRNPSTRVSCAVTHLLAEHRWCLTGTPIVNTLKDAFGLLRFLKHQPFGEWTDFHNHISKLESRKRMNAHIPALIETENFPATIASQRVQAIFATILLRRNKESTLDGKKLIELPPKTMNFENLDFGVEEREIYEFVQQKSAAVFNRYLRAGTVLKNYMHVLVLLLRLRQITVHPCLIMENAEAFEVIDGRLPEDRAVLDRATRETSKEFVELVKKRLLEHAKTLIEKEKAEGEDATIEEEECPICTEPLGDDAVVTAPCAHFFCRECISAHITKVRSEDDGRFAEDERECPMCRTTISLGRLYMRKAFQPTDDELNPNGQGMDEDFNFRWEMRGSSRRDQDNGDDLQDFIVDDDEEFEEENPQKNRKPKKYILSSDEEDDVVELSDSNTDTEEFSMLSFTRAGMEQAAAKARAKGKGKASPKKPIKQAWTRLSPPKRRDTRDVPDVLQPRPQPKMLERFIPSAKMKWVMSQLKEWRKTHPSDKCIILSQWTSALELMSSYLDENFIEHIRYQGDMSQRERVEALDTFKTKKSTKVLLLSLKAGGVGLNLVAANRVISLDLAWNSATDFQAFDRAHRVGQKSKNGIWWPLRHITEYPLEGVSIHRLVINNTVEQRLIAIQEKKQGLADGSLGEGTGKKMARLSVRELASLFGLGV